MQCRVAVLNRYPEAQAVEEPLRPSPGPWGQRGCWFVCAGTEPDARTGAWSYGGPGVGECSPSPDEGQREGQVVGSVMIAWKAVACYESNRTIGEAALDGCLAFLTDDRSTWVFPTET